MSEKINWTDEYPFAITASNIDGDIVYLNEKSALIFADEGGYALLGKKLSDCHNQRSNEIIERIISSGKPNIYTIEKNGIKKLIVQSPFYKEKKISGLVEISFEIPDIIPHFKR